MEIKDLNSVLNLHGERVFCVINKQVSACYIWSVDATSSTYEGGGMEIEVKVVRPSIDNKPISCSLDKIFMTLEEGVECLNKMLDGKPAFFDCIDAQMAIAKAGMALGGYKDEQAKDIVARLRAIYDEIENLIEKQCD